MGKSEELIKKKLAAAKLTVPINYEKQRTPARLRSMVSTLSYRGPLRPMGLLFAISKTSSCLRGRGVAQLLAR